MQLTATVYDANNEEIAAAAVSWTSGDSTVAMVDTDGLVTAVANGICEYHGARRHYFGKYTGDGYDYES